MYQIIKYFILFLLAYSPISIAFPPYKSTDADTADPYNLELRLGIVQLQRENGDNEYITPLLRANFGFPNKFEILSEFEYKPKQNELGEGAVGFKWAPIQGTLNLGIETLALLPVNSEKDGLGVESQLVVTVRNNNERMQLHVNAGRFHDPRGQTTQNGWRTSILTEWTGSTFRPGLELFAKKPNGQETDLRVGAGIIKSLGRFEIRSAVHVGLTSKAPDIIFNFWLSTKIPLL